MTAGSKSALFKADTRVSFIYNNSKSFIQARSQTQYTVKLKGLLLCYKVCFSAGSSCSYPAFILSVTKAINPNHLAGVF